MPKNIEKVSISKDNSVMNNVNQFKIVANPQDGYYENGDIMDKDFIFYTSFTKKGVSQLLKTMQEMANNNHLSSLEISVFDHQNYLYSVSNISKEVIKEIDEAQFKEICLNDLEGVNREDEEKWLRLIAKDSFFSDIALEIDELIYELNPYEYMDQFESRMDGYESIKIDLFNDPESIQNELLSYIESFDSEDTESIEQVQNMINLIDLVKKPSLDFKVEQSQSKAKEQVSLYTKNEKEREY